MKLHIAFLVLTLLVFEVSYKVVSVRNTSEDDDKPSRSKNSSSESRETTKKKKSNSKNGNYFDEHCKVKATLFSWSGY